MNTDSSAGIITMNDPMNNTMSSDSSSSLSSDSSDSSSDLSSYNSKLDSYDPDSSSDSSESSFSSSDLSSDTSTSASFSFSDSSLSSSSSSYSTTDDELIVKTDTIQNNLSQAAQNPEQSIQIPDQLQQLQAFEATYDPTTNPVSSYLPLPKSKTLRDDTLAVAFREIGIHTATMVIKGKGVSERTIEPDVILRPGFTKDGLQKNKQYQPYTSTSARLFELIDVDSTEDVEGFSDSENCIRKMILGIYKYNFGSDEFIKKVNGVIEVSDLLRSTVLMYGQFFWPIVVSRAKHHCKSAMSDIPVFMKAFYKVVK